MVKRMTYKEEWWDYLDWETMEVTWWKMPEKMRQKLRDSGINPSYDTSKQRKNGEKE